MEQQVEGAVAHVFCHYAEELGFVADAQDLDDVVESGLVKHFCLLQQTVPLSETQTISKKVTFNCGTNAKTAGFALLLLSFGNTGNRKEYAQITVIYSTRTIDH